MRAEKVSPTSTVLLGNRIFEVKAASAYRIRYSHVSAPINEHRGLAKSAVASNPGRPGRARLMLSCVNDIFASYLIGLRLPSVLTVLGKTAPLVFVHGQHEERQVGFGGA